MGFWKTLGKYALKAAPVAAMFIPGVGPIASAAISGLSSAADTKLSGGSWKSALLSGGIGAGMGYAGGKVKGLGPSDKVIKNTSKVNSIIGGKAAGTASSFADKLGKGLSIANNVSKVAVPALASMGSGLSPSSVPSVGSAVPRVDSGVMPRGGYRWNDNPMNQVDQSSPNLAQSIFQGRQQAIGNQGFRRGYPVNAIGRDEVTYSYDMPRINQAPRAGKKREKREKESA